MKIFVSVKPNSKIQKIEKIDDTHFRVSVKEKPDQGKANKAVCKALAVYFDVPNSFVSVILGDTSKRKVVEILFPRKPQVSLKTPSNVKPPKNR
jgi:uncharacterized protein YggU (UPF0235/DUF167 family)